MDVVHHAVMRSAVDAARRRAESGAQGRRRQVALRHDVSMWPWRRDDERSKLVARLAMAANDAPDVEWDAWIAVEEADSIIAGWESSQGRGPSRGTQSGTPEPALPWRLLASGRSWAASGIAGWRRWRSTGQARRPRGDRCDVCGSHCPCAGWWGARRARSAGPHRGAQRLAAEPRLSQ